MHWGPLLPGVCFELSGICTCVSVRRRDRCTCTALIRFAFLVLFCCTLLLSVLISLRALLGSCALCSSSALSVLPSFALPVLSALLCCCSCLCPPCLPCPASGLICALVQLAPWCAGASLWVSGCSCDGSVALLSCWECG